MYPFRNILLPTNFSSTSRAALKYAAAFAEDGDGRVLLLNVQQNKVPADLLKLREELLSGADRQWLLQVRSEALNFLADPILKRVEVETSIIDGEPAEKISRATFENEIDLMTIVTRGRNRLSRAFGSSIAEELVAGSSCAVLAIKPAQRDFVQAIDDKPVMSLKRILLATNFRPSSAAATSIATQLANHTGAELHAVFVIGDYFEQISSMFPEGGLAALTRLRSYVEERMAHLARSDGSRAVTHVAEGRPYEEIVRLSSRVDADVIVIGTAVHNSLFGGTPVLGSEIERVIRNAPCPVLCVPAARVMTPIPAFVTQPVAT